MRRSSINESRLALGVADKELVSESFKSRVLRRNSESDINDVKIFYALVHNRPDLEAQSMMERMMQKQQGQSKLDVKAKAERERRKTLAKDQDTKPNEHKAAREGRKSLVSDKNTSRKSLLTVAALQSVLSPRAARNGTPRGKEELDEERQALRKVDSWLKKSGSDPSLVTQERQIKAGVADARLDATKSQPVQAVGRATLDTPLEAPSTENVYDIFQRASSAVEFKTVEHVYDIFQKASTAVESSAVFMATSFQSPEDSEPSVKLYVC